MVVFNLASDLQLTMHRMNPATFTNKNVGQLSLAEIVSSDVLKVKFLTSPDVTPTFASSFERGNAPKIVLCIGEIGGWWRVWYFFQVYVNKISVISFSAISAIRVSAFAKGELSMVLTFVMYIISCVREWLLVFAYLMLGTSKTYISYPYRTQIFW